MGELSNCSDCGKMYIKFGIQDVCAECRKKEDMLFNAVYTFIRKRENRMAVMEDVVEATGASEKKIQKFILQGRLRVKHLPNLGYPCLQCGTSIQEGKVCANCRRAMEEEFNSIVESEKNEQEKKDKTSVYQVKNGQ